MNPKLFKESNEDDLSYIKRIVEGKLIDKTIEEDFAELSELVFGEGNCYNSSEVRKRMYGMKHLFGIIDKTNSANITSDSIFSDLEKKKLEIEKEKIKFFDQRREFKKLVRAEARSENVRDFIKQVAEEIKVSKPFEFKPIFTDNATKEGVLLLSDFHFGLEVDNFLNKYNKEQFLHRFNRIVTKTIEHGKLHNIKTLHIMNLNDMISGLIHPTVRLESSENTVTQTMFIAEKLSEALQKFAENFQDIKFYSVLDNHSRVHANLKESIANESFARFIPWYMETRLSNIPNIEIVNNNIDDNICIFKVCGKNCGAVHGHLDKVSNVVQNITLMTKTFLDYMFMAHYHHNIEDEVHSVEIIVNPSLVGSDSFSTGHRLTSKPAQKFMIFNPEEGRECTYSIRLDI